MRGGRRQQLAEVNCGHVPGLVNITETMLNEADMKDATRAGPLHVMSRTDTSNRR